NYTYSQQLHKLIKKMSSKNREVNGRYNLVSYSIDKVDLEKAIDEFYQDYPLEFYFEELQNDNIFQTIQLLDKLIKPINYSELELEIINNAMQIIKHRFENLQLIIPHNIVAKKSAEIIIYVTSSKFEGLKDVHISALNSTKASDKNGRVSFSITNSQVVECRININSIIDNQHIIAKEMKRWIPKKFSEKYKIEVTIIQSDLFIPQDLKSAAIVKFLGKEGFEITNKETANYFFEENSIIINQNILNEFGNFITKVRFEASIIDKSGEIVWVKSKTYEKFSINKIDIHKFILSIRIKFEKDVFQ
ncbi:MAG: hypothetical protein U9N34_05245, partial [Candidatus Cloacimonadota bacterium]|nr:hypothetical protein [Candidatus Cloacimonadota bacterium]